MDETIKNKATKILFSPIGTSDPVRDEYDGPMLHIVRWYQPQVVFLFMTAEMTKLETSDFRFSKAIHLVDSTIKIEYIDTQINDPSNMTELMGHYSSALQKIHKDYPGVEYLTNNTSGTPQMLMALALSILKAPFLVTPIQVKTPQKGSNVNLQHLSKYPMDEKEVDDVLAINLDAEDDAVNRCVELDLMVERKHQLEMSLKTLIAQYDYYGALQLLESEQYKAFLGNRRFSSLNTIQSLLEYAVYRISLNLLEANRLLQKLQMPQLAETLKVDKAFKQDDKLKLIIEIFMIMLIDSAQHRGAEFLLRLSPLMKDLSSLYISLWSGLHLDCFFENEGYSEEAISAIDNGKLYNYLKLSKKKFFNGRFVAVNLSRNNNILGYYAEIDNIRKKPLALFKALRELEEKGRNKAAHTSEAIDFSFLRKQYDEEKRKYGLFQNNATMGQQDDLTVLMANVLEDLRYLISQAAGVKKVACQNIYDILNKHLYDILN